jgi:hypothetical protein
MKWDYSTTPPTAWRIEDGEPVAVDPRDIYLCSICAKWYFQFPKSSTSTCSPGCRLKSLEQIQKVKD